MLKYKNKCVFFYKIHPLNYLYALILSFFYKVYYLRSIGLNIYLLIFFNKPILETMFKSGQYEFNALLGNAYDDFKKNMDLSWAKYKSCYVYDKDYLDFTDQLMSNMMLDFENIFKFSEIGNKISKHYDDLYFVPPVTYKELLELDFEVNFKHKTLDYTLCLDIIWNKILFYFSILILILKVCLKKSSKIKHFNYDIICQGISPQEIFEYGKQSCFYFFLKEKPILKNKTLFVLPMTPSKKLSNSLKNQGINWIKNSNKYEYTKISEIFLLIWHLFNENNIRNKSISSYLNNNTKLCMLKSIIEYNFLKKNSFKIFISNNSDLENAGYVSAITKSQNIKLIMWQYSQFGVIPANLSKKKLNKNFCGRLVQSIIFADLQFVWDAVDIKVFEERNLQPIDRKPKFIVSGPLMSGNSDWLSYDKNKLRSELLGKKVDKKIKIWICIFDLPTFEKNFQNHRASINRFLPQMQDKFFYDLINILEKFENIGLVYKPKRRINKRMFYQSKNLLNFLRLKSENKFSNRLILLPNNIDPYIPFACSDYCIGVPFTSAVFASNYFNKLAVYYDPLNIYKNCFPKIFKKDLVTNFSELSKKIELWISKTEKYPNKVIDISPSNIFVKNLKQICN